MATTRKQMYLEKLGNSNFSVPTPVTMEEELLDGMSGVTLPTVTSDDEGKILMVDENGKWISAYDEDRVDYKRILKGLIDRSITELTIPDGVTSIGDGAFIRCAVLTSITIPDGVTSIGSNTFNFCVALTSIIIPESITSIGAQTFYGCSTLESIVVRAATPPTIGSYAFNNISSNAKIYVPAESVDAYKAATNWSTYASIIEAIPEQ